MFYLVNLPNSGPTLSLTSDVSACESPHFWTNTFINISSSLLINNTKTTFTHEVLSYFPFSNTVKNSDMITKAKAFKVNPMNVSYTISET